MDRDEILAKSRLENRRCDERERRIADEAGAWGIIAVAIAAACVFLIRVFFQRRESVRSACHPVRVSCRRERL